MAQVTNTAAREFWEDQMRKHPQFNFGLTIALSVCSYIWGATRFVINGHAITSFVKWAITVGGRIATSILFFAALWVAGRSTEPETMSNMVGWFIKATDVDHAAAIAFALLPEILLLGCALITIDEWVAVARKQRAHILWALLYTVFVGVFGYIAITTFLSFLSHGETVVTKAVSGTPDGMTLFRALAGWLYALAEMIHAGVMAKYGGGHETQQQVPNQTPPINIDQLIQNAIDGVKQQFETSINTLTGEQVKLLEAVEQLRNVPQTVSPTVPTIDYQTIIDGVTAEFQGRFTGALNHLKSEMERQVRVSVSQVVEQRETRKALNPGGKLVPLPTASTVPSRPTKTATGDQTGQMEAVENANAKAVVYGLLSQNSGLQVADIVRNTGISKTTVWRHWNNWHKENPGFNQIQIVDSETEQRESEESAS
jgi:hypothetical protein